MRSKIVMAAFIMMSVAPLAQPKPSPCSLSDITIKDFNARFVDKCTRTPCMYMKGIAVLKNSCAYPVGVQIKIIGYDKNKNPLDTKEFWPASTSNIAPGEYTFSLDMWLDYDPGFKTFSLTPIRINNW